MQTKNYTFGLRAFLVSLFAATVLVLLDTAAQAHLADEMVIHHRLELEIDDLGIFMVCSFHFGGLVCNEVWQAVDKNKDHALSEKEIADWGKTVAGNFCVAIDGRRIDLNLVRVVTPTKYLDMLSLVEPSASFHFYGRFPAPVTGESKITLASVNYEQKLGRFEISLKGAEGVALEVKELSNLEKTATLSMKVCGPVNRFRIDIEGAPPADKTDTEDPVAGGTKDLKDPLKTLLAKETLTLGFLTTAFGLAFLLGMGHALAPGHGKAIVAAYLIGSGGRVADAILLGIVVTLTHTISVIMLGLILLFVFSHAFAEKAYPWIEATSGTVIAILGIWLFYRALHPEKTHSHLHTFALASKRSHVHSRSHTASERGYSHHTHSHGHKHRHEDENENGPEHLHSHDHDGNGPRQFLQFTHKHKSQRYDGDSNIAPVQHGIAERTDRKKSDRPSLWSLLTLGITGGMVPCPDALIVLLIAINLRRTALGLLLIVAFTVGLATVLIATGILMVKAKSLVEARFAVGSRLVRMLPLASSTVVFLLGTFLFLKATGILPDFMTPFCYELCIG